MDRTVSSGSASVVGSLLAIVIATILVGCSAGARTSPSGSGATPTGLAETATATIEPTGTVTATTRPATAEPSAPPKASLSPGQVDSTTVGATEPPAGAIEITMFGPPPRFRPSAVTAAAGDIVFYLRNDSPAADPHGVHTLAIGRSIAKPIVVSDEVAGGRRAIFTVRGLARGVYQLWCTFPGHAGLGQVGTLTVE